MKYRTILFDLDGTLTEPYEGITKSFQYALNDQGITETDPAALRRVIGPPLRYSFLTYYGMSEEQTDRAVEKYRERFSVTGLYENQLYEGIPGMLSALKARGAVLAVASSKAWVFVEKILEHFDIARYFDFIAGSELDHSRSEKDEILSYALERLGVTDTDRREAVMVGDRMYDLIGARDIGVDGIGVTYGYGGREELAQYPNVYIADTVGELKEYLLG